VSLALAVGALLLLAALTPLTVRVIGRDAGYLNAAVFLGLAGWLASSAGRVFDGVPVTTGFEWLPQAGLEVSFRMDGLGLLFALIVLGIGAAVMAYGARYFAPGDPRKASRYLSLLTFFAASMLGLVLADDLVLLFVFWELTSISSFFLIGGKGEGGPGATRAFLTTALGGLALFAGVALVGAAAGSFALTDVLADPSAVAGSTLAPATIVLLLLAAFTKSAQFPFHYWLPGAMVAPTPVSTYLHAATMVKAGIYLMFRFTPVYGGMPLWRNTLVLVGLGTAVFGAVVALRRTDLKGLLAYSTVSQLGFLTGLIGIGTPLALAAAALHTLAHALYKATLFMTVGVVDHEAGTRDLRELGGMRRFLPVTAVAGGLAAISMAGLPPLLGFISKEEAFAAFLEADGPVWLAGVGATLAVLASIGTFAYSARYYLGTFEGPVRTEAHRAPLGFEVPALVTALGGITLGLTVPWLDPVVNAVSVDTTGVSAELHLALWHGLTMPLLLSGIVVAGGLVLVYRRTLVERFQERFTTPSAESVFDRVYDRTLAFGGWVGRPAGWDAPMTYLAPILAIAFVAGATLLTRYGDVGGSPATSERADWAIVVLLAGGIAGVVQARSRMAAVAMLGLTGFTVAGWFVLLGAPDLALTQLLIETLTVVLVVLVFRHLPPAFPRGGRRRKTLAAVVAVALGTFTGVATYLLTGRRELSDTGAQFLAEGEGLTGGANVVNTILVDFRALDTLGEIAVLAIAAAGMVAIVRMPERGGISRPAVRDRDLEPVRHLPLVGMIDSPILRTAMTLLAPAMVIASLWLLVRGHDAVGGGFIGGLTAGSAVVLLFISRGHERVWQSRFLRAIPLLGGGLVVAVLYGFGGLLLAGAFLAGAKVSLPFGIDIAASLLFDIGVFLVVVGLMTTILRHLGQDAAEPPADPDRYRPAPPLDPGLDPALEREGRA
jgi:multicomponent Na+:H+ antiporter subunit A